MDHAQGRDPTTLMHEWHFCLQARFPTAPCPSKPTHLQFHFISSFPCQVSLRGNNCCLFFLPALSLQCPHPLWIPGGTALKTQDKTNSLHLPWGSLSSAIRYRLLWMILFWQLETLTCVAIIKTIWKTKIMFSLLQCNKDTSTLQVDS